MLPFYHVDFITLLNKVILQFPKQGQEKKTTYWEELPTSSDCWIAASFSICGQLMSGNNVEHEYHTLRWFSSPYSMKMCSKFHLKKLFILFTYVVYFHVYLIYLILSQVTIHTFLYTACSMSFSYMI